MSTEKDEGVEIGRQSMKVEVLRLIARRRMSALSTQVVDELAEIVDEISKL
jgi:enoyl-CoA hydratase/carnithine racemase